MKRVFALLVAAMCVAGCKKGGAADANGNAAALKEVLGAFTKPGADYAALTLKLRPQPADYDAVFTSDASAKVKAAADAAWDGGKIVLKPAPEQTEVQVAGASIDNLKKGDGNAAACPPAYKDIADKLNSGTAVYCAHMVKPGEHKGLWIDAFVYVNGHWALFPKPFRALIPNSAAAAPSASATGSAAAP
jgi:hypothetical protein